MDAAHPRLPLGAEHRGWLAGRMAGRLFDFYPAAKAHLQAWVRGHGGDQDAFARGLLDGRKQPLDAESGFAFECPMPEDGFSSLAESETQP